MYTYSAVESSSSDLQLAAAYAAYEMVSSLYLKCKMRNPLEEKRLKLNFLLQKEKKQYELEDKILYLLDKYPITDVDDLSCEVITTHDNDKYVLQFMTYFHNIKIEVDKKGKIFIEEI